ncbi:hypothetical protein MKW98_000051 [Papaver atlanticum]|uniref:SCP domain-containing protein n=1 Tax=Papaver atlanticum TaxID=357466 RepID=A0AAD4S9C4_9MAGN|nr:hypothetical protein MKW98_000051 [Papaver atlanticum]
MKLIFLTVSALLVSVSPAQGTEYLNPHNAARVAVNDVSMIWSTVVAAFAQTYANQRISSCANTPPSGSTYGENIAYSPNSFFSASDAVARWVSEKDNYDRPANTCNPGTICTRYTQVVWNNSIQLGCARVTCAGNTGALVVCNYSPKGNIAGQVPYAV